MNIIMRFIIDYLKQCRGNELSEILRDVFSARPESEDDNATQYRMVFGLASRDRVDNETEQSEWDKWQIRVVAYQNNEEYPADFKGEPFLQLGDCPRCKISVCSHVKQAICPICDGAVYLT
jgi:hypothetical protein